MTDPTAGTSAGTPLNAALDPMGRSDEENRRAALRDSQDATSDRASDPTAARSARTGSKAQDPTRTNPRPPDLDVW